MNIWLDGLTALSRHAWAVFGIFLMIAWGQIVVRKILMGIFKERLTESEYLSFSMAGWVLPVALWSIFLFFCAYLFGEAAGKNLSILLVAVSLYNALGTTRRISLSAFVLILLIVVFVVLRFSFLQEAVLPSYFDSAEHYRIIKHVSETYLAGIAPSAAPGQPYYHAGYHLVGAAFSHFFQIGILDVMLVFGQVVLAVLPISLFFIVRHETGSITAGLFACLLAGLGWHMPSHLANWGKYPALLSLVCVHFVLSLGYMLVREQFKEHRSKILFLLGVGVLVSGLIHTRSMFVYAGMTLAALITVLWKRSSMNVQRALFGVVVLGFASATGFIQNNDALALLLYGYLQTDVWMLVLVLALIPFSVKYHAGPSFFLTTSLTLFILALFIPVELPGFGVLTILDRPYVQMLASLPLSIFGGLGFAGLIQWTRRFSPRSSLPARLTVLSVFGFVVLNASLYRNFYPSACCQFAGRDDLAAITWLDVSLPSDASILIASEDFHVTSLEQKGARVGTDGGVWIKPLTSRRTIPAWRELDFNQPEVHNETCERRLDYIYVGGMPQSFDSAQLSSQPAWYREVFALPAARIYQVIGCEWEIVFMVKVGI